ncbi:hypothetical protein SDC9_105147 [bioreactor metagenome]|uniref:Uncharacterized protein n=1 Tax=bioreactor metagenome TaxID=1076179 RepID=A0A645AZU8_9ZZZZ
MDENICFAHFIEGRFKRLNEVCGQFTDKSYRIRQQERKVFDGDFPYSSVERGKQFVLGKYFRFAQQVHQRGFAYIGIANKSCAHEFSPVFSLDGLLFIYVFEFVFKACNAIENNSPVSFQLSFSGTAHNDTSSSSLTLQMGPHSC